MINKHEYYQLIGKRLSEAISKMNLNQQKILSLCLEHEYDISQSALSKILSGSSIQVLQIAQICDAVGLNVSEVLSLSPETEITIPHNKPNDVLTLITDARNNAFRGYLGQYHIYFYTTKDEDYIHQGTFRLSEDAETHQCVVEFHFKTGGKNEQDQEIEKKYTGTACYSIQMQTIYCQIKSEEIGEISYLLFHYDFFTYQKLECRIAAAITVSSGIKRLPTMHKLLLTRKKLSNKELHILSGQLKLNNSEILISENNYRAFLQDPYLPKEFLQYFGSDESDGKGFLSSVAKINYYSFNESLIRDSFLAPKDKMTVISLLRKYSISQRYNKVSAKAEEIIYKFLQSSEKETSSTEENMESAP